MTAYPHLFTPLSIGTMTVKNRLLMSAMSINFGVDDNGHVTDQLTQYFIARASGGTGMMLVGGMAIGTLFTLFVIPSIYMLVARDHTRHREQNAGKPVTKTVMQIGDFGVTTKN